VAARWKLLAMPKVKYIRPNVLERLEALKEQGGKTIDGVPVTAGTLRDAGIMPLVSSESCPVRWKVRRLDDGMLFFLSNFGKTGTFEATLHVNGKAPELFAPVTGQIKQLARFKTVANGTRVCLNIKDRSDSCFIVFRDPPTGPAVVAASAPPAALDLSFDQDNQLIAQSGQTGTYELTMSDGTKRAVVMVQGSQTFAIDGSWQETRKDAQGYSVLRETEFDPKWGGPAKATFPTLQDWSKRPEDGIKHYSGIATYRKTFDLPAGANDELYLDLGAVHELAEVSVNGEKLGTVWCAPWRIRLPDNLRETGNVLEIKVANLWTNRLIGDASKPQEERLTRTMIRFKAEGPLKPFGLLGPATLKTVEPR